MNKVGLSGVLLLSIACSGQWEPVGSSADELVVGSVNLKKCGGNLSYYCGTIARPLDPANQVTGTINIHYEWYPHTASGASQGTIVAIEGGPGYGSCESRDYYTSSFDLTHRDMLLVDARGGGQSNAINCPAAQTDGVVTQADIAACGATLGLSSDLYGTDLAADDMAAILSALGVSQVDLYGDSYGTMSAQIFAGRHPTLIRTIVLDACYPALNADPFFVAEGPALKSTMDNVCARSPDCTGTTSAQVTTLLDIMRGNPSGQATVKRGSTTGPMTPTDIALCENVAAEQYNLYTDDPAVRSYIAGDTAPLVRLVDEVWANEEGGVGSLPADYSEGMLIAVTCQDGPMAYDMTLAPGTARNTTWNTAVANLKSTNPNAWSPYTVDEWLATPPDWSITTLCLQWPVSQSAHPEGNPIPSHTLPDVPTLVLTGDLDAVTPVGEGDQVAAEFPHHTRIVVPNGVHVTGIGDPSGCMNGIINQFVASDGATVDQSCVANSQIVMRMLPSYALTISSLSLRGVSGSTAANEQAAYAAVLTLNDAFIRMYEFSEASGAGLRGGTFKANKALTGVTLSNAKFTNDLTVNGGVTQNQTTFIVSGSNIKLSGAATGTISVSWDPYAPTQGVATVTGTINGSSVNITVPAPGGTPY